MPNRKYHDLLNERGISMLDPIHVNAVQAVEDIVPALILQGGEVETSWRMLHEDEIDRRKADAVYSLINSIPPWMRQ